MDASKGRSQEVEKSLDVSLKHIDNYRYDGEITLLIEQTTDSGGGGVIESLVDELKMLVAFVSFIASSTADCMPNLRHFIKVWNKSTVQVISGRYISCNYFTCLGRHRRHLVNNSKRHRLE